MRPEDIEALHQVVKRKKASITPVSKCGRNEVVLAQPADGGFSKPNHAPLRKKSSMLKAMQPLRSATPGNSAHYPSTSSSQQSLGTLQILMRMSSCPTDLLAGIPTPVGAPSDAGAQDSRKGIGDYRVA